MQKSRREQELELEVKRLKQENETLKKTLKLQSKQLKNQSELIEDLQKENKTQKYEEAKIKISVLNDKINKMQKQLEEKETTITNLTTRIKKDSFNSSKPSSTDNIYTKKKHIISSRKVGGKNGGQFGHKGVTFTEEEIQELIKYKKVKHIVKNIGNKKAKKYKSRYVVDTEIITVVTEYRIYEKEKKYDIPQGLESKVQYGAYAKALMCYLTMEMMAPLNKTQKFFQQITKGVFRLSEGTIVNTQKVLDAKMSPVVEEIKQRLIKEKVLHVDETGVRINGVLNWLHTCCSKEYVYYEVNAKRGSEAIDAIGILAYFVNILVHDHWKPYYKENHMTHAECNAHILRYLKGILEIIEQKDVEELIKLFVEMNETKKEAIAQNCNKLDDEIIENFSKRYSEIMSKWRKDLNKRMSKVQDIARFAEERNLLNRLDEYKENHILFIKDFDVPFDNNQRRKKLKNDKKQNKNLWRI